MQKICKSKRRDVDQLIIEMLRGEKRKYEELKKLVMDEGVTYDTFRRHLNKLVEQGVINPPCYELAKGMFVEEADENEVLRHLKGLEGKEGPSVLQYRIGSLSFLAGPKRISHIPGVLKFCEEALLDPKYQDKRVRRELVSLLRKMLYFERHRQPLNYLRIVERIQGTALRSMSELSEIETDHDVLGEIVKFFRETDKEESVRAIFKVIETSSDELFDKLMPRIGPALFQEGSTLHDVQNELIDRNIVRLLKSDIPKARQRAEEIRDAKLSGKYRY